MTDYVLCDPFTAEFVTGMAAGPAGLVVGLASLPAEFLKPLPFPS